MGAIPLIDRHFPSAHVVNTHPNSECARWWREKWSRERRYATALAVFRAIPDTSHARSKPGYQAVVLEPYGLRISIRLKDNAISITQWPSLRQLYLGREGHKPEVDLIEAGTLEEILHDLTAPAQQYKGRSSTHRADNVTVHKSRSGRMVIV